MMPPEYVPFAMLFVYFLPAIFAFARGHHNAPAIAMLNIVLGWTLLGWIVALVWSHTVVRRDLKGGAR